MNQMNDPMMMQGPPPMGGQPPMGPPPNGPPQQGPPPPMNGAGPPMGGPPMGGDPMGDGPLPPPEMMQQEQMPPPPPPPTEDKIKISDDDIVEAIEPLRQKAKEFAESRSTRRERWYKAYRGRPYGNERKGFSRSVRQVIWEVVQGSLPGLVEIFTGDFFDVKSNDLGRADKLKNLIRYQLYRKQDGEGQIDSWVQDCLLNEFGIFKVYYKEDYDLVPENYDYLSREQYEILTDDPDVTVAKFTPNDLKDEFGNVVDVLYTKVKLVRKVLKYAGPAIDAVPPWEFYVSPDAKTLDSAKYVGHWVKRNLDYISKREKAGIYRKGSVDKVIDKIGEVDESRTVVESELIAREDVNEKFDTEFDLTENRDDPEVITPAAEVWLKEEYVKLDIDNDGLLEDAIIVSCHDVILSVERNIYGRPPFRVGTPYPEPHKLTGICYPEILDQDQRVQTNLLRFIQDGCAMSAWKNPITNDPQMRVALDRRKPFDTIMADPNKVSWLEAPPPNNAVFKGFELTDSIIENKTGVTKYNQGLDSNSLNKMLCVETPVPMSDGSYIRLGDIKDGDKIIGASGHSVTVTKAHVEHFPERAYKIVFASGEEIVAGGEHLWTIQTQGDRATDNSRVVDTDEIFERMNKFKANLYIPRVQRPEIDSPEVVPFDPYILGVWLGDGHSWSPSVTTMDEHIVNKLSEWANSNACSLRPAKYQNSGKATTYCIKGKAFGSALRALNLLRRGRGDDYSVVGKHIPEVYFHASYADRLALLRGLMDTDGCHHSGALCVFSQKRGRLQEDVKRLIDSLGGWSSESIVDPGALAKAECEYVNTTFHLFDNPFSLPAKADKWVAPKKNVETQPIVSIEQVDVRLMRCLTVDAEDGLFCVGKRFTVTHNTATGINIIANMAQQKQKLVARRLGRALKDVLRDFIQINQMFPPKDVMRIVGSEIEIQRDDLRGEYEIEVTVGVGPQEKAFIAQQIGGFVQMALQGGLVQMGLVTPDKIRNAIEYQGNLQDVPFTRFMLSPEEMQQNVFAQMQQMGQQMNQLQQENAQIKEFMEKSQSVVSGGGWNDMQKQMGEARDQMRQGPPSEMMQQPQEPVPGGMY